MRVQTPKRDRAEIRGKAIERQERVSIQVAGFASQSGDFHRRKLAVRTVQRMELVRDNFLNAACFDLIVDTGQCFRGTAEAVSAMQQINVLCNI